MKTNVYIDGFNLYYRLIKGSPCKWLNLLTLCQLMLPDHDIQQIKYFTAPVSARPDDPDQPTRQQTYLRALRTIPNISIIYGHFLTNNCWMLKAGCPPTALEFVEVVKTEEKGSDVNLGVHLLNDGYKKEYETAVVITKDSDLLEPIKMVRGELGLKVGILNPGKHPSRALLAHVDFIKRIRRNVLIASQFPDELTDKTGIFRKPASW
jgi:uncharacterized LabA/DUF88 family protein